MGIELKWNHRKRRTEDELGRRTESGTGMRTRIMAIDIYMENETEREEESDPGLRIQVGETADKNPNGVTCVPPQARTRRMQMWQPRVLIF